MVETPIALYYERQWPTRIPDCSRQLLPLRSWIQHHTPFPIHRHSILQDDLFVHLAHQPVSLQSNNEFT